MFFLNKIFLLQKAQLQQQMQDPNSNTITKPLTTELEAKKSLTFSPKDKATLQSDNLDSSDQNSAYVSCPPPTTPPPPPPDLEQLKSSHSKPASTGQPASPAKPTRSANIPETQHGSVPPPIPSRSSQGSVPAANRPPPIPARPSAAPQ